MLQEGKFNILVDGQFGSCGKGLMASYLAVSRSPEHVSCVNMPNAGHVAVNKDGEKYLSKALPVCAVLNKWNYYHPQLWVGATGAFTPARMVEEIRVSKCDPCKISIHPRCGVVSEKHREKEAVITKHLGSTMQGCGTMLAEKILRREGTMLARDYEEFRVLIDQQFDDNLQFALAEGETFLHEGTQGFSLDINHGHSYPFCTSRGTTAMSAAADMGVNHKQIGEVIQVIRPYPIRVGNVIEDGQMVGHSGGWYPDQKETTWEELGFEPEITTVTGRVRRVASFSALELQRSTKMNGATQIALNFANYIDPMCYGTNQWDQLPPKVLLFIDSIEDLCSVPVTLVGTGPQLNHVCERT